VSRPLIVIAAFLALAVPAALAAPPADKGKPEKSKPEKSATTQAAQNGAAKACKAERASGRAAYKAKYGSNGLGKCINATKEKSKNETQESEAEKKAEDNAAKLCKAERGTTPESIEAFKKKYAPAGHPNGANAFGKCVSKLAKAQNS
jgi:hypothetical protein